MLNGMLSSFRPSTKLAEPPEPTSGAISITVSSQMANPENLANTRRRSIDALVVGRARPRIPDASPAGSNLLARVPRDQTFVTSLRT
jgi:hypothetical protein